MGDQSSTPPNSDSNPSLHSPLNTELSIDADSEEQEPISNDSSDNHTEQPIIHEHVSRAYRSLLVHESNRLKAENGRLLRKVEKMRCIRSSMQNIFNQLQTNDDELQTIAHRMDDIKENTEIKEE